jgi:ribonuclease HI
VPDPPSEHRQAAAGWHYRPNHDDGRRKTWTTLPALSSEPPVAGKTKLKPPIAALIDLGWSPPNTLSTQTAGQHVATVAASGLADIPAGGVLTAHTDGACSGNPGAGGWSVVFSIDGTIVAEFSGPAASTTNNRMELTAVLEAIRRAPSGVALEILTDSKNVIGWLAQAWKRREPTIAKLAGEIDAATAQRAASGGGKVTFSHVAGHSGDPFNERADQLATGAIRR